MSSTEILHAILKHHPEGINVADNHGRVPLHYASFAHNAPMFKQDVILKLGLSRHPRYRLSSLDQVALLLKADPFSVLRRSQYGTFPYLLAMQQQKRKHRFDPGVHDNDLALEYLLDMTAWAVKEAKKDTKEHLGLPDLVVGNIWSFIMPIPFDSY